MMEGVPPAYWPASGDLRVEKLTARYSAVGSHRVPRHLILIIPPTGRPGRAPQPLIRGQIWRAHWYR